MPPPQDSQRPFFATPCHDMGIDALELLAKQIVVNVRNLVSTPLPEGEYLLQSLQVAFTQGLAIIAGLVNTTAPINRIPPELLTHIFALSPGTISRPERPAHWPSAGVDVGDLHKLPKVCRYWRDLALATPTLWTTVSTQTFGTTDVIEKSLFRRSAYLPDDSSVGLVVHCDEVPWSLSMHCCDKMTEFMVTNSSRSRELHVWSTSAIPDFPLFLRSFDASILEHCTLQHYNACQYSDQKPLSETHVLPLFCRGGDRLRSLSLSNIDALPSNRFPALTLLSIDVGSPPRCDVSDLVEFLAGSPKLEEVHVENLDPSSPPRSPGFTTPIVLPRLRYLTFTCHRDIESDPVEYLLSHVSIPSACHMYFDVRGARSGDCVVNHAILDSVRRHVDGKDAVSHVFLGLTWRGIQLVFSEGSLRLQSSYFYPTTAADHFANIFNPFQELLARTVDVRFLHNDSRADMTCIASFLASSGSFYEILPNLTAISLLREDNYSPTRKPFSDIPKGLDMVRQAFDHASVPRGPQSDGGLGTNLNTDQHSIPWPALDTLWVSVQSWEEIADLEASLVARAALGYPIRRVIVTVYYSLSQENREDVTAQLRALSAEEVILMEVEIGPDRRLGAIDWIETLPERFSLPSVIRPDWPTMWYQRR